LEQNCIIMGNVHILSYICCGPVQSLLNLNHFENLFIDNKQQ
jgi:hypothetical protein